MEMEKVRIPAASVYMITGTCWNSGLRMREKKRWRRTMIRIRESSVRTKEILTRLSVSFAAYFSSFSFEIREYCTMWILLAMSQMLSESCTPTE